MILIQDFSPGPVAGAFVCIRGTPRPVGALMHSGPADQRTVRSQSGHASAPDRSRGFFCLRGYLRNHDHGRGSAERRCRRARSQKNETKRAAKLASNNTFEAVAREWLNLQRRRLAPSYSALLRARLEADVFPDLGSRPIAEIGAPELLDVLKKSRNAVC
jgi:hypothetical protein